MLARVVPSHLPPSKGKRGILTRTPPRQLLRSGRSMRGHGTPKHARNREQCPGRLENDESPAAVLDRHPRQQGRTEEVQGVVHPILASEPSALQGEVSGENEEGA